MSDDHVSDTDNNAGKSSSSIDSRDDRYNAFQSWHSSIDLLNRQPLLCDPVLGDRKEDGAPVRKPSGELIPDRDSPTGFLMAPPGAPNLAKVAEVARAQGELFRQMLHSPFTATDALTILGISLGTNLGHAGTFDYQREGSYLEGYTQHRQFRDISNVNVGVFAQQFGLSKEEILSIAGTFARARSSNADPSQPYSLDRRTREFIELGYAIGASGVFGQPVGQPRIP
jgi:hypothetical protein